MVALMGNGNVAKLLLERGDIDVNQADKDGVTRHAIAGGSRKRIH